MGRAGKAEVAGPATDALGPDLHRAELPDYGLKYQTRIVQRAQRFFGRRLGEAGIPDVAAEQGEESCLGPQLDQLRLQFAALLQEQLEVVRPPDDYRMGDKQGFQGLLGRLLAMKTSKVA